MIEILELTIQDYEDAIALWNCEGVSIRDADSRENIDRYLNRNQGLSFKAIKDDQLVGTILCGHDGRRGYINPKERLGIAIARRELVACLWKRAGSKLKKQGIEKCHLFVFVENIEAKKFWERLGWKHPEEIDMMSLNISESVNP